MKMNLSMRKHLFAFLARRKMMDDKMKQTVKFNSQKRLEMLKNRTKRCVCKYCGGSLRLRQIAFSNCEDARIEIFCKNCDRIEFGVEPEIYKNARFFVEETGFHCFSDLDDNEKTKQMTIAKVCEIITWQNQNIGILTSDGFTVPLKMNENYIGECITLTEDDLAEELLPES